MNKLLVNTGSGSCSWSTPNKGKTGTTGCHYQHSITSEYEKLNSTEWNTLLKLKSQLAKIEIFITLFSCIEQQRGIRIGT